MNIGFSKKMIEIQHFGRIRRSVDQNFEKRASKMFEVVASVMPDFVQKVDKKTFIQEISFKQKAIDSFLYPLTKLPKELLSSFFGFLSGKFPNSKFLNKLNDSEFLAKHRSQKTADKDMKALRGLLKELDKATDESGQKIFKEGAELDLDEYNRVAEYVLKRVNQNASGEVAKYDTKDERALNRFVTSLIPIPFLYNDAFNVAKKNNKDDEQARKMGMVKGKQELIATLGETWSTLLIFGMAPVLVNTKRFAAPIIGAFSGLAFNIISRTMTGRKITPINPDEMKAQKDKSSVSMPEFLKETENKNSSQNKKPDEKKKPFLRLENLLKFCAVSIGAGFSFRTIAPKISKMELFAPLRQKLLRISDEYKVRMTEKVEISEQDFDDFNKIIGNNIDREFLINFFKPIRKSLAEKTNNKVMLGELERTMKIPFTQQKIKLQSLVETPLIPFKIMYEFMSYPYKAVVQVLQELKIIKSIKQADCDKKEPFNIMNLYIQFKKLSKQHKDPEALNKAFKEFFDENFKRTFDKESFSKIDNAEIGRLTQLFGMAFSIYFYMNDDYNQTIEETGDLQKAKQHARERGLQRFTRIATQITLMDWFNKVFGLPYKASLLGMAGVAAANTFATDYVTRGLIGQPILKRSSEELQEFEKQKQDGITGAYYRFIKKLSE